MSAFKNKIALYLTIAMLVIVADLYIILNTSYKKVEYNESAVIKNLIWGNTTVKQSGEFILVWPWSEIHIYDIMQGKITQQLEFTDTENNTFTITVIVRYLPKRDQIDKLHNKFGMNYKSTLIDSLSKSGISSIVHKYSYSEIYLYNRVDVEIALANKLKELFEVNYIKFNSSLIYNIQLDNSM